MRRRSLVSVLLLLLGVYVTFVPPAFSETLDFEPTWPSGVTASSGSYQGASVVSGSILTNQFANYGITMQNVALVDFYNAGYYSIDPILYPLSSSAYSGRYGISPINVSNQQDYTGSMTFEFFSGSTPAVTNYFSIATDRDGSSNNSVTLYAYGLYNNLLGSKYWTETGNGGTILELSGIGNIHKVVVQENNSSGGNGGIAFDLISFGPLVPPVPPAVSSTSPQDQATGVASNSAIAATFSKSMDTSTITTSTFTVSNGVNSISGNISFTVNAGNTVAIFTPSPNLSFSTTYTATITTGVMDLSGNSMAQNYSWSFTTAPAPDTTPPTVTSVTPAAGATGTAVNTSVTAAFSETIDPLTVTPATFTLKNSGASISGAVSSSGGSATFTPGVPLAYNTTYTAAFTTGIKDLAGNALASMYSWTFTTGAAPDTTPPTVTGTTPATSATGVPVYTTVTATFSEPMTASTITAATFVVTGGGGNVIGNIGFATSSGNTVATLTPSSPLLYGVTYTATITTGVRDLASNAVAQNYVWTFTTVNAPDTTPPTVISTVPDSNVTDVSVSAPIIVTFSETMDTASFTPNAFILTGAGSNITCSVNASGATATFTPSVQLAYGTAYTATVTTVVKDQLGNNLAVNKTWSFTTEIAPSSGGGGGSVSSGGGGGGCSVSPTRKTDEQPSTGILLALLSPALILVVRKIIYRGYGGA